MDQISLKVAEKEFKFVDVVMQSMLYLVP